MGAGFIAAADYADFTDFGSINFITTKITEFHKRSIQIYVIKKGLDIGFIDRLLGVSKRVGEWLGFGRWVGVGRPGFGGSSVED